jgi:hypothetical protein
MRLTQAGRGGTKMEGGEWVTVGLANPRWPPSGGALPVPNNDRKGRGPHPAH